MKEEVTIKIDENVLEATLDYAKRTNTTISELAESYLQFLTGTSRVNSENN